MTTIYLIRHCEAYGNIHRRLDGIRDTDITSLGRKQIEYLTKRFSEVHIDAVYSSNLIRAVKTAAGIANEVGCSHYRINELHERKMGIFEGSSWHEVKSVYPEVFQEWQSDFDNYVIPNGESYCEAGERFALCLEEICCKNDGRTIAVVAHSMVIKAFLEKVMGENVPYGNNTAVTLMKSSEPGKYDLIYINDDSHLPEQIRISRQRWAKGGSKLEDYSLRYEYIYDDAPSCTMLDKKSVNVRAYEHDAVVGYMTLLCKNDYMTVKGLFIPPEWRKNGFATQLIGEALYSAKKKGCKQLHVEFPQYNNSVAALFNKNGLLTKDNFAYIIYAKD